VGYESRVPGAVPGTDRQVPCQFEIGGEAEFCFSIFMNVLSKVVLGLFLASFLGGTAWAQGRIGTIDLNKVFSRYWKTQEAKAMIDDQKAAMEKDLAKMVDAGRKATEEYNSLLAGASDMTLSPEQRDKNKKAAEEKLKGLRDLQDDIDREKRRDASTLDEQSQRMRSKILEEIRNAVNAKAKEAGYSMVIDSSAESFNKTPILLYSSSDANDLTDKISEDLNRSHLTSPAPSDEKTPEKKK
jgi:Skp family chaperone for outer membrane proteins